MTHQDVGRTVENVGMWVGLTLAVVLTLVAVAIWVGLVAHPGAPPSKWLILAVVVPLLPKGAARLTKGAIWRIGKGK